MFPGRRIAELPLLPAYTVPRWPAPVNERNRGNPIRCALHLSSARQRAQHSGFLDRVRVP